MTSEWLRFWLTAVVLAAALVFFAAGVVGSRRFNYVMNRIHAAGLGDTMGMLLTVLALTCSASSFSEGVRFFLPLLFLWITSPVSSHVLAQIDYYTDSYLYRHMKRR